MEPVRTTDKHDIYQYKKKGEGNAQPIIEPESCQ